MTSEAGPSSSGPPRPAASISSGRLGLPEPKKKRKKTGKNVDLEIDFLPPTKNFYTEIDFKQMKESKYGPSPEPDADEFGDEFGPSEEMKKLKEIAAHFEAKYGGKRKAPEDPQGGGSTAKKKRVRGFGNVEDFVDLGMGYVFFNLEPIFKVSSGRWVPGSQDSRISGSQDPKIPSNFLDQIPCPRSQYSMISGSAEG